MKANPLYHILRDLTLTSPRNHWPNPGCACRPPKHCLSNMRCQDRSHTRYRQAPRSIRHHCWRRSYFSRLSLHLRLDRADPTAVLVKQGIVRVMQPAKQNLHFACFHSQAAEVADRQFACSDSSFARHTGVGAPWLLRRAEA